MNDTQLAEILSKHAAWLRGEPGGERADLRCAYLSGANLSLANLRGADLSGADLSYNTIMPDGRSWAEYRKDHLAGVCQSAELRKLAIAAWGSHSWQDCPMHAAHGVTKPRDINMAAWVALYDANLLDKPTEAVA